MKKFYNMLRLDEAGFKKRIRESKTMKEKAYYWAVLILRAIGIVLLAVISITLATTFFGEDNSAMAIVIFVMILTFRFIHFSYCIGETILNLGLYLLILTFAPALSNVVPVWAVFFVHLIAVFLSLSFTTQKPQMGLGGLIGFSYCYLVGNPVEGEMLVKRAELALVGFIILAAIMFYEHRGKDQKAHYHHYMLHFSFNRMENVWQVRFAIGIAIILTLGQVFEVHRFMWMGFACSTMLARYPLSKDVHERFLERIEGIVIGSLAFWCLVKILPNPESWLTFIGLIGGVFLGFCAKYRWKTIIICFGALATAAPIYGLYTVPFLRITNNVMGAVFAMLYVDAFDALVVRHLPMTKKKQEEEKEKEAQQKQKQIPKEQQKKVSG